MFSHFADRRPRFAVLFGPEKKRVLMTLGRYPRLQLAKARTLAIEAMTRAHAGEDPRRGSTMTVRDVVKLYLDQHVRPTLKSAKAVERRLKKNCLPVIGAVALADLHKRDIHRVMAPIMARGREVEAARVFEDVRAMARWATAGVTSISTRSKVCAGLPAQPPRRSNLERRRDGKAMERIRQGAATIEDGREYNPAMFYSPGRVRRGRRASSPRRSMPRSGLGLSPLEIKEREAEYRPVDRRGLRDRQGGRSGAEGITAMRSRIASGWLKTDSASLIGPARRPQDGRHRHGRARRHAYRSRAAFSTM